jgi:uncharacterized protein (DUF1501 family)
MCKNHARHAHSGPKRHLPRSTTRRDVLRFVLGGAGLAALGPMALKRLPVATGAPQALSRAVFVNLIGGNDGHNTVIPRLISEYYTRRPTIQIPPGQELSLNVGPNATTAYGLHPAMDRIHALWQEGSVALVHKVGYPSANLSHFTSGDIFSYAVRDDFGSLGLQPSGWVARYADQEAPTPMGAVAIGVGRPLDFVGGTSNPFLVSSLAAFNYQSDPNNTQDQRHRLAVIQSVLSSYAGTGTSQEAKTALELGHQLAAQIQAAVAGYSTTAGFPTTNIGNFLRDASILIEGGFESRLFYTGFGSFDLHGDEGAVTGNQANLLTRLDDAVGAFAQDMKDRGQWNATRIVIHSEFGRRNYENGSNGTDHGHGNVFLVLGGGLNGGVHGPGLVAADLQGEYPDYAVDFRDVYRDVLTNHLGAASVGAIFPEPQPTNTVLSIA